MNGVVVSSKNIYLRTNLRKFSKIFNTGMQIQGRSGVEHCPATLVGCSDWMNHTFCLVYL